MLIPSVKSFFENARSRDYYERSAAMKDKKVNGCIHTVFPDFEEVIFYSEGQAVTALHESNRWITVSDEQVEPAENKAITGAGKISAYELSPAVLHIFAHKNVESMIETELGQYITVKSLTGKLEDDHSTCMIKVAGKDSVGYIFINFGKRVAAVFESGDGKSYDDNAVNDMSRIKGRATAAIYFMIVSPKYLKTRSQDIGAERQTPMSALPVETTPEPATAFPINAVKPQPAMAPVDKPFITAIAGAQLAQPKAPVVPPVAAPAAPHIKLIVVMSEDKFVGLHHRSKLHTLEALEDSDVAWVDHKTFKSLKLNAHNKATIILPGGKEYHVTLKETAIKPEESKYIIIPRKLRNRLSINKGAMVEVKA